MQRQWARLARRGWCAGVVPTAPRSLERTRREMKQAVPSSKVKLLLPNFALWSMEHNRGKCTILLNVATKAIKTGAFLS